MTAKDRGPDATGARPGVIARTSGRLARFGLSQSDVDAVALAADVVGSGADRISDAASGVPITVVGRLRSVTLRPDSAIPAVEADLYDGTGNLTLVFLGRRTIPGITPGRTLTAHGRPVVRDGVCSMVNPRYELAAVGE